MPPQAATSPFTPGMEYDSLNLFDMGMNSGVAPLILPKNQMAFATNLTTRGDFPAPRCSYRKIKLNFDSQSDPTILGAPNIFQGMEYYRPDTGPANLIACINGRLLVITPTLITADADVEEIPITGGPNPATEPQAWTWQAEKWIIWNDGVSLPVFYDGSTLTSAAFVIPAVGATVVITLDSFDNVAVNQMLTFPGFGQAMITVVTGTPTTSITIQNISMGPVGGTVPLGSTVRRAYRSNYGTATTFQVLTANSQTITGIGTTLAAIAFNSVVGLNVGDIVTIAGCGQGQVTNIAGANVTLLNISLQPIGGPSPNNVVVSWQHFGTQMPPGRMGAYVMGRNWMSLTDGKQFIASDIAGGPSGTVGDNFRDAVLQITENQFLFGGGNFSIPGSIGDIRAITFLPQQDASLGQGPVLIVTPDRIYTCSSPVDRTTWTSLTNPIVSAAAIGNGGLGQWSTFPFNSDVITRAIDGIRSFITARRDFHSWNNTPISHELEEVLKNDNNDLLRYSSGCFFDNRAMMTVNPKATDRGVIHPGLVAMNCDSVSTLIGKQPPVWDGLWTGLNILKMLKGEFGLVEHCYAMVLNDTTGQFELWEILPSPPSATGPIFDEIDGARVPITFSFESSLIFKPQDFRKPLPLRLEAGEMFIDDLTDTVQFQVFFRPDSEACWQPWTTFSVCQTPGLKPLGYRSRIGLGDPNNGCDPGNDKPYRNGFWFQLKLIVTGSCKIRIARFAASRIPDIPFAQPAGCCPGEDVQLST